ncbi:hypothetical protein L0F63_002613 [Massospora cicadina]|nr:hypothetical protein L0F63_002613 [Massospora cicadina]
MVLPKSKKGVGLGRTIIRDRFKLSSRPTDHDTNLPPWLTRSLKHTAELDDGPKWTKLQSITHEGNLEEFLHTAELAGTDFTAERQTVTVVTDPYRNQFLLSAEEERVALRKHHEHRDRLTVPRRYYVRCKVYRLNRPYWEKSMPASTINRNEQNAFLDWRRGLAMLQEVNGLLLTPYERNLEVWRQLWRVIERSQLVVQIVDARNPLFFRSLDVEKYVVEVDPEKRNLLLINKADLLTYAQRYVVSLYVSTKPPSQAWADYFDSEGITYVFYSAAIATAELEAKAAAPLLNSGAGEIVFAAASGNLDLDGSEAERDLEHNAKKPAKYYQLRKDAAVALEDPRVKILSCDQLLELFHAKGKMPSAGQVPHHSQHANKLTVGLIGYPNVGKSSTLNALMGSKRVAVGATPGKTKHFQTLHLDTLILCDCPGLVFPSFATTQAEMVCNGVLPIDQLREHTAPTELVTQRIPQYVLEAIYGIRIPTRSAEEGGTGVPTAEELLKAYAVSRGYTKSSEGNPDEARAARYILKDYDFNLEIHDPARLPKKKVHVIPPTSIPARHLAAGKLDGLDAEFFRKVSVRAHPKTNGKFGSDHFTRVQLYPHQKLLGPDGRPLPQAPSTNKAHKMHKKGKKHVKQRSGQGFD